MNIARFARVIAAVLPALAFADLAAAQAPKPVRVGDVAPIAADWPHFVAADKGLYKREGVDPQVTYVGNVANTVQQLAGGTFDVAVSRAVSRMERLLPTALPYLKAGGSVIVSAGPGSRPAAGVEAVDVRVPGSAAIRRFFRSRRQ